MVTIGVVKETKEGEKRVAATPESVKKLKKKGLDVLIEKSAGAGARFTDEIFTAAGAQMVSADQARSCQVVFGVHRPEPSNLKKGSLWISFLEPYKKDGFFEKCAAAGIDTMAMELIPRTSRAQSMDALSSQAGIAGYRAVVEAATQYPRFFPMLMTSAGSAKPAKLTVLGAGVAGLQAIATARRLGAQVEAYDVRPEVKEQILSLGAKFIDLDLGEQGSGTGGYAKELSDVAKKCQQELLAEKLQKSDIVITTANVPGKKAPVLISEQTVSRMRPGSVIIDMAAANGGNCPLSKPDQTVDHNGVTIVGITNYPSLVASDASLFYANNLVSLVSLLIEQKDSRPVLNINLADDIVTASLVTHQGKLCRPL